VRDRSGSQLYAGDGDRRVQRVGDTDVRSVPSLADQGIVLGKWHSAKRRTSFLAAWISGTRLTAIDGFPARAGVSAHASPAVSRRSKTQSACRYCVGTFVVASSAWRSRGRRLSTPASQYTPMSTTAIVAHRIALAQNARSITGHSKRN